MSTSTVSAMSTTRSFARGAVFQTPPTRVETRRISAATFFWYLSRPIMSCLE
jgi:hypothetical protein